MPDAADEELLLDSDEADCASVFAELPDVLAALLPESLLPHPANVPVSIAPAASNATILVLNIFIPPSI